MSCHGELCAHNVDLTAILCAISATTNTKHKKTRERKQMRSRQPNPMEAAMEERRGMTRDPQRNPRRSPRSRLLPPSLRRHQSLLPKKLQRSSQPAVPPSEPPTKQTSKKARQAFHRRMQKIQRINKRYSPVFN
jgi:hypothetical protein